MRPKPRPSAAITVSRASHGARVVGSCERVSVGRSASPPAMNRKSAAISTIGVASRGSRRSSQINADETDHATRRSSTRRRRAWRGRRSSRRPSHRGCARPRRRGAPRERSRGREPTARVRPSAITSAASATAPRIHGHGDGGGNQRASPLDRRTAPGDPDRDLPVAHHDVRSTAIARDDRRVLGAHPVRAVVVPTGHVAVGDPPPPGSAAESYELGTRPVIVSPRLKNTAGDRVFSKTPLRGDAEVRLVVVAEDRHRNPTGVAELELRAEVDGTDGDPGNRGPHAVDVDDVVGRLQPAGAVRRGGRCGRDHDRDPDRRSRRAPTTTSLGGVAHEFSRGAVSRHAPSRSPSSDRPGPARRARRGPEPPGNGWSRRERRRSPRPPRRSTRPPG